MAVVRADREAVAEAVGNTPQNSTQNENSEAEAGSNGPGFVIFIGRPYLNASLENASESWRLFINLNVINELRLTERHQRS